MLILDDVNGWPGLGTALLLATTARADSALAFYEGRRLGLSL